MGSIPSNPRARELGPATQVRLSSDARISARMVDGRCGVASAVGGWLDVVSIRIAPPRPAPPVPTLDPFQQQVVDHGPGPLLVLAGPGTGKTTTLVEAIV